MTLSSKPKRREGAMSWSPFLKLHWEVLTATDFFTMEVATWHSLVIYSGRDGAEHAAS